MKKYLQILILSLISLVLGPVAVASEQLPQTDSLQISLLTCGPGEAAYELYGHTALRVQNTKSGEDLVFNYGIFDFDTPNFALRFMLGDTDYTIGVTYFDAFANSYRRHGRYVVSQVLNLRPEEEARLLKALKADWMQPGWTYRYNLLYDNCTTRAFQQIKQALGGPLVLPKEEDGLRTFRDILHDFSSESSPWVDFGDDLLLGTEVDRPITVEKQMFAPLYAERFLDKAYVVESDGSRRNLVARKEMVVQTITFASKPFPLTPMMAFGLLLVAVAALSVLEYSRRRLFRWIDYVLMTIQGLAGFIVAFLFFLSVHPAVDSNWLIVLLNPLPLLYLPVKIWQDRKGKKDYYYRGMAIALLAFFVIAVADIQDIPSEMHIVALILLVRTLVSLRLENHKK